MKRIFLGLAALGLFAVPAQAAPGDMSVATFLGKAEALKAKGMAAMFSSDVKVLMNEGKAAAAVYRARLEGERKAGKPSSCPPPKASVSSNEMLAHLASYPAATRPGIPMHRAMGDFFARKFPCR
ncbi:hypothetical protein OKA06_01255 [Novosphingobium sp. MW5]|nr:hypothetical protein [Novosphingobium sp. MW5]